MKGQPDMIIANNHKKHNGFCIEFKSPTNNYKISEAQLNKSDTVVMDTNFSFPMITIGLSNT